MENGSNYNDFMTKSEYDGLDECLNDETTEKDKSFKLLLKKYQGLVVDYYNQDLVTKKSVAMLIEKNNRLVEERKRIEAENIFLKKQMNEIVTRMDSGDCARGDNGCIKTCNSKYYDYNEKYDKSIPHSRM